MYLAYALLTRLVLRVLLVLLVLLAWFQDYRREQVKSVLEDVFAEVIVRYQQQAAKDLLVVESVLDDCVALVETGEA